MNGSTWRLVLLALVLGAMIILSTSIASAQEAFIDPGFFFEMVKIHGGKVEIFQVSSYCAAWVDPPPGYGTDWVGFLILPQMSRWVDGRLLVALPPEFCNPPPPPLPAMDPDSVPQRGSDRIEFRLPALQPAWLLAIAACLLLLGGRLAAVKVRA